MTPRAVIEARQHHVVAGGAEPARHVAQLLADRRRVHVEDDDGKGSAALGMGDEGGGMAVLGGDIDLLVDHGAFLYRCGFDFAFDFALGRSIRLQGNQGMTRQLAGSP